MLNRSQIHRYREQGFLAIEGVFRGIELRRLKAAAEAIVEAFDPEGHRSVFSTTDGDAGRDDYFLDSAERVHCFLEEEALDEKGELIYPGTRAINKIGHALHDREPEFREFCRLPVIAEVLGDVGLRDPLLWQTMYIFKQPAIGGEVRWHQDATYLASEPSSVVGLWVAIEDASEENGCLWMQPGEHRSPLREIYRVDHERRKGELTRLDERPWAREKAVPVPAPAGTLVLFHDHMPHYSSPNRSAHSRHAFTMHVAEADSRWSPQNWLQRRRLPDFRLQD